MIKDNIARVKEIIRLACKRVSRSVEEITLVCITKGIETDKIIEVVNCGITDIGENRVQEAFSKYLEIKQLSEKFDKLSRIKWHMVGHLQTNKVAKALDMFDMIQSVDSLRLAERINSEAEKNKSIVDVLIEVNTSGEASKFGIKEKDAFSLTEAISKFKNIRILGLMTIGPFTSDKARIRQAFRNLRQLKEKLTKEISFSNLEMRYLSMGMTNDYVIAIEEGSNMIRLGRAIFHNTE
jgi:hypothetical protein